MVLTLYRNFLILVFMDKKVTITSFETGEVMTMSKTEFVNNCMRKISKEQEESAELLKLCEEMESLADRLFHMSFNGVQIPDRVRGILECSASVISNMSSALYENVV